MRMDNNKVIAIVYTAC